MVAVKKYQGLHTQATIFDALHQALEEHHSNHIILQALIIDIILMNRMCKLVVFNNIYMFNYFF